ncbi:MAG: hypothetical protein GXP61_07620 [Epsilonproteobacteria bacterium]|nr:hypothetical protein [Campylobacterota bacterium]
MQKKILGVFFTLLFVGVIGILYSFFNYTNDTIVQTKQYPSPMQKENKTQNIRSSWISGLAKSSKNKYEYPVNELFMQINLHKYIPPKVKSYKLVISNIDRYSVFCVIQTLSDLNLPFVLSKDKNVPNIYINSSKDDMLKKVTKKLKEYDINSKIVEEWL